MRLEERERDPRPLLWASESDPLPAGAMLVFERRLQQQINFIESIRSTGNKKNNLLML